jgi:hypothetical protein
MTASFSLRLRLKVYSLKMRFAAKTTPRSTLQRPTVFENSHSICSGIAICVGLGSGFDARARY